MFVISLIRGGDILLFTITISFMTTLSPFTSLRLYPKEQSTIINKLELRQMFSSKNNLKTTADMIEPEYTNKFKIA